MWPHLLFLHPVGLQKRLLGSLPKPGDFGTGRPEVVACCALCLRPDANALGLNFVTKCPKEKNRETAQTVPRCVRCGKHFAKNMEMSRNVQSGNTQNLKSMVIQRSFPKWSVAERRKTAAASDQAAVCACAHSRYFTGGSPSGLRV